MRAQLKTLPEYYYYYAGLADKIHGDVVPTSDRKVLNYTSREPLGRGRGDHPVELAADPDHEQAGPGLCVGNTVVIKPSEYTSRPSPGRRAGHRGRLPPGRSTSTGSAPRPAGAGRSPHPGQDLVHRHGRPGARIASAAASRFIGCTLELGGKSPNIVFEDANVANAAMGVVAGIFAAAGQTCIAGSRVFAHRAIYDELLSG